MTETSLNRADLSGANLRGAILTKASLQEANLNKADLSGELLASTEATVTWDECPGVWHFSKNIEPKAVASPGEELEEFVKSYVDP